MSNNNKMATKATIIRTIGDNSKQEPITIEIIRKRTITRGSKMQGMQARRPKIIVCNRRAIRAAATTISSR